MKSNIYKIKKGDTDLSPLLAETEKVSKYNKLTEKETLYLRLLAEDLAMAVSVIKHQRDGEPICEGFFSTPFEEPEEPIYKWRCPEV